jgi:deoxyribonuclease-4
MPRLRLGCHLTIARGLPEAVRLAEAVGANTFQFFTRNPRGSRVREMGEEEIARWKELRREKDLYPVVGHLPYTVNLAAPRPETWDFGRRVLREDLERAQRYGAEYFCVHPGSHGGAGEEEALRRIARAIAWAFDGLGGETVLLLETMAGQGSEVGYRPEHLGRIMEELGWPSHVGVCLDSCHLFAAGYDLQSRAGIDSMLEDMERSFGLERIKAMHLNDSRYPRGSRRDRHEFLGKGYLGPQGMTAILTHPFLSRLPLIIETQVEDYLDYAGEIRAALHFAGLLKEEG